MLNKRLEEEARQAAIKKEEVAAAKVSVTKDAAPAAMDDAVNNKLKEKTEEVNSETKAANEFSANPCNSPSAKFLSTCKK
jgi:hypothetical protein